MAYIMMIKRLHDAVFTQVEKWTDGWFLGLFARFVFFAVLYFYFLNSFGTKVGEGFAGFFQIQDGAYYQIAPLAMDAAGGDRSAIPFFPWAIIVPLGTYMELILPALVVAGLFTRVAALGMIGFVAVQTLTDIYGHMVDAQTIGALFDRFPDSLIADQRLLWSVPLVYLALKGAGLVSLDALLSRLSGSRTPVVAPAM